MKRILVDYKKLDHKTAALLIETYPDGYGDEDIIAFKNAQGEFIEAVELRTDDILYLVKISKNLANFISNFDDAIEKELEDKTEETMTAVDSDEQKEMEIEDDSDFYFEDDLD